jgi:hypothetical protein
LPYPCATPLPGTNPNTNPNPTPDPNQAPPAVAWCWPT